MDRMEQLAHNGHVGLHRLLSAFQKVLVIGTDTRLAARADHRREEESSAEMGVAHPRDTSRLGDGGTGLVLPGIEPCMRHPLAGGHILGKRGEFGEDVQRASLGDASNGEEDLESLGEIGVFPDEGDSELLQVSNTPIEMLEMFQDVLAHEGSDFRTALGHVQAILFSGARSQESLESPRDGADLQDSKGMRRANSRSTWASMASVLERCSQARAKSLTARGLMTSTSIPGLWWSVQASS